MTVAGPVAAAEAGEVPRTRQPGALNAYKQTPRADSAGRLLLQRTTHAELVAEAGAGGRMDINSNVQ